MNGTPKCPTREGWLSPPIDFGVLLQEDEEQDDYHHPFVTDDSEDDDDDSMVRSCVDDA